MRNRKIALFVSALLQTRYSITIKGKELLNSEHPSLYLPNHQAEVDPMILLSEIAKLDDVGPMVSETYYNMAKPFMRKIGAVPVADFEAGNRDPNVLENMRNAMLSALRNGRSVLLYPSGQLCQQGYEKIQNKQSAYKITQELDDYIRVIGVRQHGLWGSIWSRAWWGKSPNFLKVFLRSIFYVLANLVFFVPKRSVEIEFVDLTQELKRRAHNSTRQEFNRYMEDFLNVRGEEEVRFMKHYFFAPKIKHKLPKRIRGTICKGSELKFRPLPENQGPD